MSNRRGLPPEIPNQSAAISDLMSTGADQAKKTGNGANLVGSVGSVAQEPAKTAGAEPTTQPEPAAIVSAPPASGAQTEPLAVVDRPVIEAPAVPAVAAAPATPERNLGGRPKGPDKERVHYRLQRRTIEVLDETFRRGRHPVSQRKFGSPSEVLDALVEARHTAFLVFD